MAWQACHPPQVAAESAADGGCAWGGESRHCNWCLSVANIFFFFRCFVRRTLLFVLYGTVSWIRCTRDVVPSVPYVLPRWGRWSICGWSHKRCCSPMRSGKVAFVCAWSLFALANNVGYIVSFYCGFFRSIRRLQRLLTTSNSERVVNRWKRDRRWRGSLRLFTLYVKDSWWWILSSQTGNSSRFLSRSRIPGIPIVC